MNGLIVSSSPHVRSEESVARIMLDVVIALIPAAIASVIFFRWSALMIILVSVLSAVAAEALFQKLTKQDVTINDWSAVVTGILLAFNLPPTVPLWIPIIGSAFAIIIVKHLFGGLGHNFMNPALAARAVLLASWPVRMTTWLTPGVDGTSSATPLAVLKGTEAAQSLPTLWNMLIGNVGGSLGETSAIALLIGAAYLMFRGVINWRIPFTFIGTVAVLTWAIGGEGSFAGNALYHVFAGGLILGAFFMATDYSSSPITEKGQIIMGIGCGILTSMIRIFGGYPEGVSYSILLMNVATPLIDKLTMPKVFGEVKTHG